jgi:uncharacterized protein (DUF1015 family)
MSEIQPFAGIHYASPPGGDVSSKLAPPYDVLDAADKDQLLAQDSANFVGIDLPHLPPKSAGPPEVYAQARATLEAWLASGVLARDAEPAVYVYYQDYTHAGQTYTRKMFFARLMLEPFGSGSVFPHEQTFGGPKEDRLALTQACEANLSPIFGVYPDPENQVAATLAPATDGAPLLDGTLDGVRNRVWALTDPAIIRQAREQMQTRATFIADGHHRYGTALNYQAWANEQRGPLPADDPANFVLCVFCAMEDPGLLILPTHRVVPNANVTPETFDGRVETEVRAADRQSVAGVLEEIAARGPQAIAWFNSHDGRFYTARPEQAEILDAIAPDKSEAWRRLGLTFLHAFVLDHVVTPQLFQGQAPEIQYVKSDAGAVAAAKESRGTAFLLQPTTMEELRGVCSAGDLMPQKSTFFYPKLASGLLVNPLS